VTKKAAPAGWSPHEITHRIDGHIVDPENPDHVPSGVAALIRTARFGGDSIADIKARMVARQRALEHRRKRQHAIIKRLALSRHA
jgi:hypothetical protein